MLIIESAMTNESISSALVYLWLAVMLLFIVWLVVRRGGNKQKLAWMIRQFSLSHPIPLPHKLTIKYLPRCCWVGLLLIILGQLSFSHIPQPDSWFVGGLMGLGGCLFLWAGRRIHRNSLAEDRLARWLHRLGHWLGVAGWQALLLCLAMALVWLTRLAAGNEALARYWGVSVVAWLLALIFALLGGVSLAEWRFWLRRGFGLARWEWWLLLALFVGAWLLRGTAVTQFPNTFSGDEGSAGLHAALFCKAKPTTGLRSAGFLFPLCIMRCKVSLLIYLGKRLRLCVIWPRLGGFGGGGDLFAGAGNV